MGHRYPKRNQLKYTKQQYRVRNWREYEAGLRRRGDLTLWFSEEAIAAWRAPAAEKPGGQPIYSDFAIEAALTVRLVYGLALRQTEGFSPVGIHAIGLESSDPRPHDVISSLQRSQR